MREVLPGIHWWPVMHPRIHSEVSSYWVDGAGVLIDPFVPPDVGLDWFAQRPVAPAAILLSNRHHYRASARFADRFGCAVYCNATGLHEFTADQPVVGFVPGDELPGGVIAVEVGVLCPDETALHLPAQRALVIADGVVRGGRRGQEGALSFVPDVLMDEPEQTKAGLLAAFERLLGELDFDHVLLAHGGPVVGDGRAELKAFVACGGRTTFEL